jgi:hypothetical protein
MRGWSLAAGTAACLAFTACGDPDAPGVTAPGEPPLPGAALSVYGLGDVNRAVPNPCPDPGHRQFDFWVGQWNVLGAAGTQIATSVISSEMDDCVIMEDYIGSGGFRGKSLSVYDPETRRWHQTFVDNIIAGSFRLAGGLEGDAMVMRGSQPVYNFATQAVRQRDATVTWSPLSEGRVRQTFLTSFDGAPATVTFDGTYLPAETLQRATPAYFPYCESVIPEFRQLDFWVGGWSVAADGLELGSSEVRKDLNGCLIQEDFQTPKGYRSRSYVYFDFVVERWFRTFADNTGAHAELSGVKQGDGIVMTGEETGPGGQRRMVRVTIAPDGPDVRQQWESSGDGGRSWKSELGLQYRP